ncbi:MAG: PTS sugar transporter subunit IIA [Nostoc sp. LLA-1]|nr:PTS sugar transporter subunit IIA [Cyanocohniella sp. LLY]
MQHERTDKPVHVVLLLLSSAQRSSQEHLAQLAEIVRYFSHLDNLDELIACKNIEQLQAWFDQQGVIALP